MSVDTSREAVERKAASCGDMARNRKEYEQRASYMHHVCEHLVDAEAALRALLSERDAARAEAARMREERDAARALLVPAWEAGRDAAHLHMATVFGTTPDERRAIAALRPPPDLAEMLTKEPPR